MGFGHFNSRWKLKKFRNFFWFLSVDMNGFCTGQPERSERERTPPFESLNDASSRERVVSDDLDRQGGEIL